MKPKEPLKPEEVKPTKIDRYTALLSRRKWLIIIPVAIILLALIVIGVKQNIVAKNQQQAFLQFSAAKTIEDYRRVNEKFPDTFYGTQSLFEMANIFFKEDKYPEARKLYQEFLDKYPTSKLAPYAKNSLALTYQAENKYEQAIETYSQILEMEHRDFLANQVTLNIALCYELIGDYASAKSFYSRLLPQSRQQQSLFFTWQDIAENRLRNIAIREEKAEREKEKKEKKNVDKSLPQ